MPFSTEPAMPESNSIDFRAPPPSPIASGRRSSVANDDVLTEFLQHSLRVPDLVLPDKIFPRQKILETPPTIDFQSLSSRQSDSVPKILDSLSRTGCFQLVNYGIPSDFLRLVLAMSAGIFSLPLEKRAAVTRSPEKLFGFEEVHGEEESEASEEFVWCSDKNLKLEMESIWPSGYTHFSNRMEIVVPQMENVANKILQILEENTPKYKSNQIMEGQDIVGSVCYLHKHKRKIESDGQAMFIGYDVIRMLIRGTDYSHALCLHTCDGSSEFHVYSKKGWLAFSPHKDAIIVTVGDQTQTLSGGQYKHVLGRPIFRNEKEDSVSMAFLYCPPIRTPTVTAAATAISAAQSDKGKIISLGQQIAVALILTLIFHVLVYVYKKI